MSGHGQENAAGPLLGIAEHFRPGDHARVEAVLEDLARLRVRHLRTRVSGADCSTPEGEAFYTWLINRAAREVEVVPCFVEVPPSVGTREPEAFAAFVEGFIQKLGRHFEWVELWDDGRSLWDYDWRQDVDGARFAAILDAAAKKARALGKKVALGGTTPFDPGWWEVLSRRGVLDQADAMALRGFPDSHDAPWPGWETLVSAARMRLDAAGFEGELWISAAGYSTWRHDERRQLCEFLDLLEAPVTRAYWYSGRDLPKPEGVNPVDEREHHHGLRHEDGTPKLLFRLWSEYGLSQLPAFRTLTAPLRPGGRVSDRPVVIFGGAGFIGSNVAHALLEDGRRVHVFDSLGRVNVERNLRWLREQHGDRLGVTVGDVRDAARVREVVDGAAEVYHFAAQVAVTTSLVAPMHDFEVNAQGTLNVLEAVRAQPEPPPVLFTSTNKVYGGLEDVLLQQRNDRYEPESEALRRFGISEQRAVEFESPYGCSKGAADQYLLDYARSYGLCTAVFRMSCIYGPRQFGNEDQGWVAHFLIRALEGKPITLYGDGMQVRDILFVDDLVRAMRLAMSRIHEVSGRAFNIGGGPERTVSLLELVAMIERLTERRPELRFDAWRTGDQRYYVSDIRGFQAATGWAPRVTVEEGVSRLHRWLQDKYLGRRQQPIQPGAREVYAG
ncbi:MAG: NAD-dependent epimerase/dehydratase family protein [Myxococcaceae bacterium]